jgi:hypothetical protein
MNERKFDVIYALLLEHGPLRVKELQKHVDYPRETIRSILGHPPFVIIDATGFGYIYGLKCHLPPPEEPPAPAVSPLDPALMRACVDHVDTAHMVGIWARRGDSPRALEMLAMWRQEDVRIKELCKGAIYDHTNE